LRYLSYCFGLFLIFSLVGCQSLSPQQRAQNLSRAIQQAYAVPPQKASRLAPMIVESALRYQLPAELLAALIQQESSYRSDAISPTGALGLTQVQPRYWQQQCAGDLLDERININCGAMILAHYQRQTEQHPKKSLAYYNVGPSGYVHSRQLRRAGKRYAKAVLKQQKLLKAER
jgi:soluble lytic murein transglycosylase-like protein